MKICCVICSDLFVACSEVYSTPCGHLFHYICVLKWLEKSKTCPQCRNKVRPNSLFRLFLTSQSNDSFTSSDLDLTILHNRADNAELAAKIAEKDLQEAKKKVEELENGNKSLSTRVKDLEARVNRQDSAIFAYKEQIRYLQVETQNNSTLKEENLNLREVIRDLMKYKLTLNGTYDDVKEMVRTETNVESLALITTTLKKSLVETNQEKNKLMIDLKRCQNEVQQKRMEIDLLKKQLESSENPPTKERGRQLKRPFTNVAVNNEQNISVVDLTDTPLKSAILCPTTSALAPQFNFIDNKKKPNHPAEIPAASSLGPYILRRSQSCTKTNNGGQKFSHVFPTATNNHNVKCTVQVQYNGLGGSSKDDPFPEPIIKRKKNIYLQFQNEKPSYCLGCGREIQDEYLLSLGLDLEWHVGCLKCQECHMYLNENCTCFVRDGKTYCKTDYVKFLRSVELPPKCEKCKIFISQWDYVMRTKSKTYHLSCFRCCNCYSQLTTGDEFGLGKDGALYCEGCKVLIKDDPARFY